jgi:hypothetical protein
MPKDLPQSVTKKYDFRELWPATSIRKKDRYIHVPSGGGVFVRRCFALASRRRTGAVTSLNGESTAMRPVRYSNASTFVDLTQRRGAPWPDDVRSSLLSLLEVHRALS